MIEYYAEQYLLSKPIILDNATNFCTCHDLICVLACSR